MDSEDTQTILIVEDSAEDFELAKRAFRKAGLANNISWCRDGDEALDYLGHRGRFADPGSAPRPGIILLDLNLPGTDGREVCATIKASPELKPIPVIILTTSHARQDVELCYELGANTYVCKPLDIKGFMEAIWRLNDYWFKIAVLPRGDAAAVDD